LRSNFAPGLHVPAGQVANVSTYYRWTGQWSRLFVPGVVAAAEVASGSRVLDVSTGTGEAALIALLAVGASGVVVGVDIAPAMLVGARDRLKNSLFCPLLGQCWRGGRRCRCARRRNSARPSGNAQLRLGGKCDLQDTAWRRPECGEQPGFEIPLALAKYVGPSRGKLRPKSRPEWPRPSHHLSGTDSSNPAPSSAESEPAVPQRQSWSGA